MGGIGQSRLFETVVEAFLLGDLNRGADALIVWAETEHTGDKRLIGAVTFARSRKRAMQLDQRCVGCATDKAASQEAEATGTSGMAR